MLKATMRSGDGVNILLLALSGENLKRLKEGKPIHLTARDLEVELGIRQRHDIIIAFGGETEEDLKKTAEALIGLHQ